MTLSIFRALPLCVNEKNIEYVERETWETNGIKIEANMIEILYRSYIEIVTLYVQLPLSR